MKAVEFKNVWEKYRIKFVRDRAVTWDEFWALENINFEVQKGSVLGIIGENGAGKTTLLKLIAGMIVPDRGEVKTEGKISSLMELGAGFHPEFTGRENIYLNANLYGFSKEEMDKKIEEIINFVGIGKFVDAPIKYYSQGMYVRLAFALAVHVEPDVFLIDDILAVGDEEAQRKCLNKIFELKKTGKTIVLISHDMNMIYKLCDRVIFLKKGRLIQEGPSQRVVPRYLETVGENRGIGELEKGNLRVVFNNGKVLINWKGLPLTKHWGGYSSFYHSETQTTYLSINADWEVSKSGENEILAKGIYHYLPVRQTWKIKLEDEKQFDWQVDIESKDSSIKEEQVNFLFRPEYKEWIRLDRKEEFPPYSFKHDWQEINLNNYQGNILALGDNFNKESSSPFLSLEIKEKNCSLKVLNTGYDTESRVISLRGSFLSGTIKLFPEKEQFEGYIQKLKEEYKKKKQEQRKALIASRTISKGHLKVYADVESKSLRIYYKEKEITKGSGLHSSFLVKACWYDSSFSDWEVEKKAEELYLTLFCKELSFTQRWHLSLNRDNQLLWEIDLELGKPIKFDLLKNGLSLIEDYKSWFCSYQQGDLPQGFNFWKDMPLEEKKAELFGLRKEGELPAIVLNCQNNKTNFSPLIQSSDRQAKCRVLQVYLSDKKFSPEPHNYFKGKLSFLDNESFIKEYLEQQRKELLKHQEKQRKALIASRTVSRGDLKVYADVESKSLRIYYKEKEITKGGGFFTLVEIEEFGQLSSNFFSWNIIKKSSEKLDITLHHQLSGLIQKWILTCQESNILKINIDIDLEKSALAFINQRVILTTVDNYTTWKTAYEEGIFSTRHYIGDVGPVRLKYNKISKILLENKTDKGFPKLVFDCSFLGDLRVLGIEKRKDKESILLHSTKLISRKNQKIPIGEYSFFNGRIIFGQDVSLKKAPHTSLQQISKGNLKVIFDDGRGRIFSKGKELTAGLGMFTSIRSSGFWYDSAQAIWQVKEVEKDKIILEGDWPYISISQIWELKMLSNNSIYWKVEMEIYAKANLEIEQSNLMLLKEYKNWIIPEVRKGNFLDEFSEDYDISPFRFWYGKINKGGLGVTHNELPSLSFRLKMKDDSYRTIIENTDCLYEARLLQYQRIKGDDDKKTFPKKYKYVEGIIKIESKI